MPSHKMTIALGVLVSAVLFGTSAAYGDLGTGWEKPPPEGAPGSYTDHVYQKPLGGCGFGVGAHPQGDDLVGGGFCHKKPKPKKPTAAPAQGGGGQGLGPAGNNANGGGAGPVGPPPPPPPPSPAEVAGMVAAGLEPGLADGVGPRTAPDWRQYATLVGIDTYLWVAGAEPVTGDGVVQGVAVTVTATPAGITWDMGEGHDKTPVDCTGTGIPWTRNGPEPDCAYEFQWRSTTDDPEGTYTATAHLHWDWTWTSGHQTGALPQTTVDLPFTIKVQEAQAITN